MPASRQSRPPRKIAVQRRRRRDVERHRPPGPVIHTAASHAAPNTRMQKWAAAPRISRTSCMAALSRPHGPAAVGSRRVRPCGGSRGSAGGCRPRRQAGTGGRFLRVRARSIRNRRERRLAYLRSTRAGRFRPTDRRHAHPRTQGATARRRRPRPTTCVGTWPNSARSSSQIQHARVTCSPSRGWDTASCRERHAAEILCVRVPTPCQGRPSVGASLPPVGHPREQPVGRFEPSSERHQI